MLNIHMTMAEAFSQVAETHRDQEAIVCGEERFTYGQILEGVHAVAAGLSDEGIRKGDKVVSLLSPGRDFACLFFALAEIGGVIVPLNPQMRSRSLGQVLDDAKPVLIVTEHPVEDISLPRVASMSDITTLKAGKRSDSLIRDLIENEKSEEVPPSVISPNELLTLLYTSGTTGIPKGTLHSHRSLIAPIIASKKIS
jgi:acyl-CoA synthetase (AMP-forming)/AMP-acid ligase II